MSSEQKEKKSWASMTNEEWSSMFRKATTCEEVFDVVDNGYDAEEWDQKQDPIEEETDQ